MTKKQFIKDLKDIGFALAVIGSVFGGLIIIVGIGLACGVVW